MTTAEFAAELGEWEEAGLVCEEATSSGGSIGLEWSDVDLRRGQLTIERSEWKSEVTATKGMKVRVVPMTQRLQKALAAFRHSPR